jgi:hypothetical protein
MVVLTCIFPYLSLQWWVQGKTYAHYQPVDAKWLARKIIYERFNSLQFGIGPGAY